MERSSALLPYIYGLLIAAGVCFICGVIARFIRHREGTLWYRGTMALLNFAIVLLLLAIYVVLENSR
ncbi:MAG TPA: hypothetical protein VGQ11_12350 [Candidatus Acidoferrales bacterium]|nr:hypothetical protein [Candidatus Acidoferrales bacterium]